MVRIREVNGSDWNKLKDLLRDLVEEKPPVALELEPLIMKGKEWLEQFPKGNLGHFLVAEDKGKIVAFCYVAVPKFYQPIAYVGICVRKRYRHHDLGTKMFYEAALWAAGENLEYIIADVWNWNEGSIRFFTKLGFTKKTEFKDKFKGKLETKIRLVKKI
jgi:RimJ/RimL family protein N-acetyltransferase